MALAIIVGGYLFSVMIQNRIVGNLVNQYATTEGIIAQQLAQTLEIEIAQTEAKLNLIAQLPDVMSGSTEVCNAKLAAIIADPQTRVGNIGRVYPDGTFHCSVNPKLIGLKASKLGPYIDTIFNDENHAAVMSRAIKPPGLDGYVVAIHVPVWGPHHEFLGTLGGAVYLNDLEKKYLGSSKLPEQSGLVMLDDDGTILFHFKKEFIGKNYASPEY